MYLFLMMTWFIFLIVSSILTAAVGEEGLVTFTLYDNGASTGGVNVTMAESDFPESSSLDDEDRPGEAFAMKMSENIKVSKYLAEQPVIADRAFREDGELITSFDQLLPTSDGPARLRRIYLVAEDLEFVWPFVELGHKQEVSANVLPPATGIPILLESVSDKPRVFRVFNMFSTEEANGIIDNAVKEGLERSTVGSGKNGQDSAKKDHGRTSENSWDSESPGATAMISRSFQLTNIEQDDAKRDGLQVVRYTPGQGYNTHPDYFEPSDDKDFNFSPYSGGSNRFATVFMYLNNVTEGGFTAFPRAPGIVPTRDPPSEGMEMFRENSWERTVLKQCYSKLAVPAIAGTGALFYSITPDGRIDPFSHHAACPLTDGVKWGANIWIWNKHRYGEIRTGESRQLKIVNSLADEDMYISWEGRNLTILPPGQSTIMNSFEFHRFKASIGSYKGKAISYFSVRKNDDDQMWSIKATLRQLAKATKEDDDHDDYGYDHDYSMPVTEKPEEPELKKIPQVKVLISNHLDKVVHIYFEGEKFADIEPGKRMNVDSFESHSFKALLGGVDEAFDEYRVLAEAQLQSWDIMEKDALMKEGSSRHAMEDEL